MNLDYFETDSLIVFIQVARYPARGKDIPRFTLNLNDLLPPFTWAFEYIDSPTSPQT